MRKGFGVCCIILGVFCLFASLGFILYNHHEEEIAQIASKDILQDVRVNIPDTPNDETILDESISEEFVHEEHVEPIEPIDDIPQEMLTAKVDGYDCIGILSIPVLELELPILTDWSYQKLKIAPCHYYGSYYDDCNPCRMRFQEQRHLHSRYLPVDGSRLSGSGDPGLPGRTDRGTDQGW